MELPGNINDDMKLKNQLVQIPPCDWPKLRDLFLRDWPNQLMGYYTVDNYVRWYEKLPTIKNLHIYSLNGDWSDGTFVVIDRYQLLVNSLEESGERLEIALSLLDWSKGFKVSSFLARHRPPVVKVVESKGLKREFDSETHLYYYPKEKAHLLESSIPNGITLKPMSPLNAPLTNEHWPNHHDGSEYLLKRFIEWNPNIGAFTDDGQLVAWCFRLQCGALGVLQTLPTHYRQGLGRLVTVAMVKILAKIGMDTFALVGTQNSPSIRMFESIGFKIIDKVHWLRTRPVTEEFVKWSDEE